ncbi:MAG: thiosulfate oxidation carrier protein SoxY [Acidihalobacter sp.]|uniref:thiosulfate oxidation carrier protein SoxY n=1 Tax=Acidihalobacter sp. TaxID=1872108 RepID=UPI00307E9CE5
MNNTRRVFLKGSLTASALGVAAGAGLLTPSSVLAATWPKGAFERKDLKEAMKMIDGSSSAESGHVTLRAPDIAENGAVVPVTMSSDLDNVVSLTLFAKDNPYPLNSNYVFSNGGMPYASSRIKLSKTMEVMAVARTSDGKLYSTKKQVKVTIGGCGG